MIVEAILTFVFSLCFHQSQNKRSRIQKKAGLPERLKNVDKKMANLVLNEIVDQGPTVTFNDIGKQSGLSHRVHLIPPIHPATNW